MSAGKRLKVDKRPKSSPIGIRGLEPDEYLRRRMERDCAYDAQGQPTATSIAYPAELAVRPGEPFLVYTPEAQFGTEFKNPGARHVCCYAAKIEIENAKRRVFGLQQIPNIAWACLDDARRVWFPRQDPIDHANDEDIDDE